MLLALIGPFALGVLAALYIGGANYRLNIITLPRSVPLIRETLRSRWSKLLLKSFLFLTPTWCGCSGVSQDEKGRSAQAIGFVECSSGSAGTTFVCAFAGGAFICLRAGSDINYFFEAGMAASVALLPSAIVLFNRNKLASAWFFSLASAILCCVCLIQLAAFMSPGVQVGIPARLAFLRTSTFGRLRLITQQQEDERRMLASLIASAPKPILFVDDIFSQPWHSTNGSYPAFVNYSAVFWAN